MADRLYDRLPPHLQGWQVYDALCVACRVGIKARTLAVKNMKRGELQDRKRLEASLANGTPLPPVESINRSGPSEDVWSGAEVASMGVSPNVGQGRKRKRPEPGSPDAEAPPDDDLENF
jgi:hypothetical protein